MKPSKKALVSLGFLLSVSTYGQAQMTETTETEPEYQVFSPGDGIQFNTGVLIPMDKEANALYVMIPEIEIGGSLELAPIRTFLPRVRFFYQEDIVDREGASNTRMLIYGGSVSAGLRFNPGAVKARRFFIGFGFLATYLGSRSFDPVEAKTTWTSETGGGTYFEFGAEFFLKDRYSIGLSWNASFTQMTVPILKGQSTNNDNFSAFGLNVFFGFYPGGWTKK